MKQTTHDRYIVHSLARGMTVLEVLGASGGLSVTEVADRAGLSKSAAFATLHTLVQGGLVADSGTGHSRRYRLGAAMARLGALAKSALSVPETARPAMEQLASDIGHGVRLGTVVGGSVEVVERVEAPRSIRIDLRMGGHELLHSTGMGKALMSTWPSDVISRALGPEPFERRTAATRTSLLEVLTEVEVIRQRGYAIDDEEDYDGIVCLGAPLGVGRATWAISTTMLKAAVAPDERHRIGQALRAAAESINISLDEDAHH